MKEKIFTFHKTVQGYRHIQENIPCQDSSLSYEDSNKEYQIIAVADGHGDPACHRSDRGSSFAVEITQKCLMNFAESILAGNIPFEHKGQQDDGVQQLTNSIISKWNGAVRNDIFDNPVTDDDLKEAGQYSESYKRGERLEHLYGTTLIAVLCVQNYMIFIHQGDGRCDVFYSDGSIDQPIPWDDRCQGAITTSMCDKDVFSRIRTKVINLEEKEVIACFIGSDGVEDSYYDNEKTQLGTHRFYMDLSCVINDLDNKAFDEYLDEMLPSFSKQGSTDDVSVAGIVNIDKIADHIEEFRLKVLEYDQKEELRIKYEEAKSKIVSMTRKHGILSEKTAEIEKELEDIRSLYAQKEEELNEKKIEREERAKAVENGEEELKECREDSEQDIEELKENLKRSVLAIQQQIKNIENSVMLKEKEQDELIEQLNTCDDEILIKEEESKSLSEEIQLVEERLLNAKSEFEEYDKLFKSYKEDILRYESEMKY